jgi:hypothetical protein
MVTKIATSVLSQCDQLARPGLDTLAPEFDRVAEGGEYRLRDCAKPFWHKGQAPCDTNQACLARLAEMLLPRSIPANCGILHGDPRIFQRPPFTDSSLPVTSDNAVCLLFSGAKSDGFFLSGRYRKLLLGLDKNGNRVLIYAHRLVCWIFQGPVLPGSTRKVVTCHSSKGCPVKGACAHPLHLRCG